MNRLAVFGVRDASCAAVSRRWRTFLFLTLAAASIACGETRADPVDTVDDDRAIVETILHDFANWRDVTFERHHGVLDLNTMSRADPNASPDTVRSWSMHISNQIGDDLIDAFIDRNHSATSITPLVSKSRWARLHGARPHDPDPWDLPKGIRAIGSLTLPGISADGTRALIQIHHSWSIHEAVVTHLLSKQRGVWHITARDQIVFV
jgi:hypothetical protein